jgi:hypothetical protein
MEVSSFPTTSVQDATRVYPRVVHSISLVSLQMRGQLYLLDLDIQKWFRQMGQRGCPCVALLAKFHLSLPISRGFQEDFLQAAKL